jgi:hypothetical protein
MFRAIALLVLVAGVLLGVRGFGILRGTDDFGRGDPCPETRHVEERTGDCAGTAEDRRRRSGIALLIAAGFGLGMGLALLVVAGRIGRVPPSRWLESPLPRKRGGDGD